jgi:hypothetical protein
MPIIASPVRAKFSCLTKEESKKLIYDNLNPDGALETFNGKSTAKWQSNLWFFIE